MKLSIPFSAMKDQNQKNKIKIAREKIGQHGYDLGIIEKDLKLTVLFR